MEPVGTGVIGAGTISATYLRTAARLGVLKVLGIADIDPSASARRSAEFGVPQMSVAELLADPRIELVVNLTIPAAHHEVSLRAIEAGKHVYSEKPLAISLQQARELLEAAEAKGVRVGCAPDTFLGGPHQTCRKLIDDGAIGRPLAGTAFFMRPGHELWHPNPVFYYQPGGGPMLDMGPYYITALVNLLGPVRRVAALSARGRTERVVATGPLAGMRIPVEVDTHASGTLEFETGALVTMVMSFDVARHRHSHVEIYGTDGALSVPDPNWFDGEVELASVAEDWRPVPVMHGYAEHDLRIMGAADMAAAIRSGRRHRASGALALHVLEVIEGFQQSSERASFVDIASRPERPAALPVGLKIGEFD